jgi:hypothetical protein
VIAKQWRKGLGLLPALGLMVGCGAAVEAETAVDAPVEARSVEAAAVTEDCKPVTLHRNDLTTVAADTYAVQGSAGTNHGGETRLISDGSPRQDVYLRFHIVDPASIVQARLRLYATDGSTDGPAVHATGTSWEEHTLTWSNRPAPTGSALANVGAIASNSWVEYDVTAAVGSNTALGFVLVPDGGNGVDFVSGEDADTQLWPQLIITRAYSACTYQGTGGAFQSAWVKGGAGDEYVQALATDSTGTSVVAGFHGGSGTLGGATFPSQGGLMLGRFRADGTHEWSRAYPMPAASLAVTGVTLTPLGNVLMVGHYMGTPDFGTGPLPASSNWSPAVFIAKFSPNGNITWAKGFTAYTPDPDEGFDPATIFPNAVATDANGSLIVTGYFFGYVDFGGGPIDAGPYSRSESENNAGLFVAKFSWEGHHVFSRAYEAGANPTVGQAVATDSQGNVLLGGSVSSPNPKADGRENPFIAKLSPTGDELWFRALHGAVGQVMGVAALPGDAVAFAGHFGGDFTFAGQPVNNTEDELPHWDPPDLMMGVLEANGTDRWARARGVGDYTSEYLRKLTVDAQGNLTLLGIASAPTDLGGGFIGPSWLAERPFLARYTADGAYRWARTLDPELGNLQLAPLPGGATLFGASFNRRVTVEGQQFLPAGGTDILLLKFAP